jgi:hypothetical protein
MSSLSGWFHKPNDAERLEILAEDKVLFTEFLPALLLFAEVTSYYPGIDNHVMKQAFGMVVHAAAELVELAHSQGAVNLFLHDRDSDLGNCIMFLASIKVLKSELGKYWL